MSWIRVTDEDGSICGTASIGKAIGDISARTVIRLIERGLLKAHKLPGRGRTTPWRVSRDELARFREALGNGDNSVGEQP